MLIIKMETTSHPLTRDCMHSWLGAAVGGKIFADRGKQTEERFRAGGSLPGE